VGGMSQDRTERFILKGKLVRAGVLEAHVVDATVSGLLAAISSWLS